ncbi:luciferin sulfotransferase-like [Phlebotomus papatasi]|uniref:luciferin sulfotransferase-like n=1 Tax=Phlebotomus papatasi TaxID=29031 RepID=UPI00248458BA|nr:luciferin sulfotransferase-like [Phlebotomus papatasi]
MPIVWEKFSGTEEEVEKVKYAGMEEFIIAKNTDIPHKCLWSIDQSCFLPGFFRDSIETFYNFEVRPDDVWLVTFPKSGSTWTQEMIWQICNNLDYERTNNEYESETFIYLESHLQAPLLPKQLWTVKPRIIYVARHIKDVAISFYHHYRNIHHFSGNWQDFFDIFMKDRVMFAPYHTHVYNFWQMRNEENILFLTYEEMKRDHPSVIRKTAHFLGKSLNDEQISELADYLSFSKFSRIFEEVTEALLKSINIPGFLTEIHAYGPVIICRSLPLVALDTNRHFFADKEAPLEAQQQSIIHLAT